MNLGLQDRLRWEHTYQGLLEQFYALTGDAGPAALAASGPLSTPEQRKREELQVLETKLAAMEHKQGVGVRWNQSDAAYLTAAGQRKRFMIQKLHAIIAARFLDHHALQQRFEQAAYRERQSLQRLTDKMASIKSKVADDLCQLQRWHAAPGDYHGPAYNLQGISAAGVLAANTLPWQRQSAAAGLLSRKLAALAELEDRLARCLEEVSIVRREAQDMQTFYQHYAQQVEDVMAAMGEEGSDVRDIPGAAVLGVSSLRAVQEAFQQGRLEILQCKLTEYRRLGAAAAEILDKLQFDQAAAFSVDSSSCSEYE
ncbi:MAG: hypothetical protein ACRDL7_10680, partial [Gaiellaceae bacterium]